MIAGIDGDVLRYELGAVAMAKEEIFGISVERPWKDSQVYDLVDERITSIIKAAGCNAYEVYLTGPGNYRESIATIKPYKGTRIGLVKPYHWETVSRRLKDHWGATTFNGIEADDWLGIRGTEEGANYVACSRDKDIRQVGECIHYSWPCGDKQPEVGPFAIEGLGVVDATFKLYGKGEKKSKSWSLKGYGTAFLYGQLLVGDSVDNIPGCPGVGPAKIPDLFGGCVTEEDYFRVCVYQYHRIYGDSWRVALTENMRLLYLMRNRDELDITFDGNIATCKPNKLWEIKYDSSNYFFGSGA